MMKKPFLLLIDLFFILSILYRTTVFTYMFLFLSLKISIIKVEHWTPFCITELH